MASKRALKKSINGLTGELLNECFAFGYFHPDTKQKQLTETMWALAHTRNELISRINRGIYTQDRNKKSTRSFFHTLRSDISNMPRLMDHIVA